MIILRLYSHPAAEVLNLNYRLLRGRGRGDSTNKDSRKQTAWIFSPKYWIISKEAHAEQQSVYYEARRLLIGFNSYLNVREFDKSL